jgi:dUTP pyrophosphatase
MKLHVVVLPHGEGLALPAYATDGAAGLDLVAALAHDASVELQSMERVAVPTGLQVAIPPGFEGQVRARSGRALREGIAVLNAPGTIDSDYRGELRVLLVNLGREKVVLRRGERIAQLVIAPIARVEVHVVPSLDETNRGAGGFGSTGT